MTVTTFLIFAACLWRILTLAADLSISGTLLYQERVWFRVERYREKLRGPVLDLFVVDWSLVGSGQCEFLEQMVEMEQLAKEYLVLEGSDWMIAFFEIVHVYLKTRLEL